VIGNDGEETENVQSSGKCSRLIFMHIIDHSITGGGWELGFRRFYIDFTLTLDVFKAILGFYNLNRLI